MTSKKPAASKRTSLPRASDYTREFLKDWQHLSHSGRYDMNGLKEAMLLLVANNGPLPPEWLDHPLTGDWLGHRECHVGGDFLLIYRLDDSGEVGVEIFPLFAGNSQHLQNLPIFYRSLTGSLNIQNNWDLTPINSEMLKEPAGSLNIQNNWDLIQ